MGRVADFAQELSRRSKPRYASWHRIDLHNHTPVSFDYKYTGSDAVERTAESILKNDLSVVMFTDHEILPDQQFVNAVQDRTGRLLLRGIELNVFVDAYDKAAGKIAKDLFYHLLVGFDPLSGNSPDYWLQEVYRRCGDETRQGDSRSIRGVTAEPEQIADILADANAIVIPAHLHTTSNLAKSRSVDDIYADPEFLRHARKAFTALEVVNPATAAYFDGAHAETGGLHKACIRSSDSHEPAQLGWRHSYAQMEAVAFSELKAALELPFRTAITRPDEPQSCVIGLRVTGTFFPDLWLSLSPHCNMLIAVKGSGKTSVLECLRFALGVDVPSSRAETVSSHLNHILGASGSVTVLIKRNDGARMLVERRKNDPAFLLTFEDDRQERLSSPDGLLFPAQILGWHEIEQAATDVNVRRVYMDTIAGRARIRTIEEDATAIASRIREKHIHTSQRYNLYRDLQRQVSRLQELRKGLQQLTDSNLIALRNDYQLATEQREALTRAADRLSTMKIGARAHVSQLAPLEDLSLQNDSSPLRVSVSKTVALMRSASERLDEKAGEVEGLLAAAERDVQEQRLLVDADYQEFVAGYTTKLQILTPEQRSLLEAHREVLEQTKALASLEAERDTVKQETLGLLNDLTALCDSLASRLDERTRLRQEAIGRLNADLASYGVRLAIVPQQESISYQELRAKYAAGSNALNQIRSKVPDRLAHLCLKKAYGSLYSSLDVDYGTLLFESAELGYFLGIFENDDLKIELKVGKAGQEFTPIDQLSAGQRCTAVFPILLRLDQGPLIVDQPEDNLDNRHIANAIAPALLADKRRRQMVFTSHNANLVVLSDAENIVMFESDGATGRVEEQGFFSTRGSRIGKHVIDVLDGGERALELRSLKYGLGQAK